MTGEELPVTFVQRTSLGVPAVEVEQVEGLENRPVSVGPAPQLLPDVYSGIVAIDPPRGQF